MAKKTPTPCPRCNERLMARYMPGWSGRRWHCAQCRIWWHLTEMTLVDGRLDTLDAGIRLITALAPMRIDELARRLGVEYEMVRRRVRRMADRLLFDAKCYPPPGPSGHVRYLRKRPETEDHPLDTPAASQVFVPPMDSSAFAPMPAHL